MKDIVVEVVNSLFDQLDKREEGHPLILHILTYLRQKALAIADVIAGDMTAKGFKAPTQ